MPSSEEESDIKYREVLKKADIISEVLVRTKSSAPFLDSFNALVRESALQDCKEIYKEEFEKQKEFLNKIPHLESDDKIIPQRIMKLLVQDLDSRFEVFYKTVLERELSTKDSIQLNFDKLKLSPSLLNLIPKDSERLVPIFELCVRWALKMEYNWDLILRAQCYGLVNISEKAGDMLKQDKPMPQTVIRVNSLNSFMKRIIDKSIHNIFSSTTANISKKVNKTVIACLMTALFGATMVTVGGFVVSFVDLPFSVDVNIFDWAVNPMVSAVKKYLKIGDDNISAYLLHEAINQTEIVNTELKKMIEILSGLHYGEKTFKIEQKNLIDLVEDLINNKQQISNVRTGEDMPLDIIYKEHKEGVLEGWTEILEDPIDFIDSEEKEDGFTYVEVKDDIGLIEGGRTKIIDEFEVVDMTADSGKEIREPPRNNEDNLANNNPYADRQPFNAPQTPNPAPVPALRTLPQDTTTIDPQNKPVSEEETSNKDKENPNPAKPKPDQTTAEVKNEPKVSVQLNPPNNSRDMNLPQPPLPSQKNEPPSNQPMPIDPNPQPKPQQILQSPTAPAIVKPPQINPTLPKPSSIKPNPIVNSDPMESVVRDHLIIRPSPNQQMTQSRAQLNTSNLNKSGIAPEEKQPKKRSSSRDWLN